jgi:predicted transcriptional regulator
LVVAFGYYLEKYSGATEFSPADINRCYYDAKMDTSNTSQMIIRNIRRGYVMQAKPGNSKGRKKSYTLTNTGEQFVSELLGAKV